jgi:uncharacterized protein YcfL
MKKLFSALLLSSLLLAACSSNLADQEDVMNQAREPMPESDLLPNQ